MAVEDQKYDDLVKCVNALLKTGRTHMARTWLIALALDILKYYGYEVRMDETPPPAPAKAPSANKPL